MPVPMDDFDGDPNTTWVCRAASGSAQRGRSDVCQGAGEQSQDPLFQAPHGDFSGAGEGENTYEPPNVSQTATNASWQDFDTFTSLGQGVGGPMLGAPGPAVIPIKGGALPTSSDGHSIQAGYRMQRTYASTTECILQNLSRIVCNPSARCYANAPWRAFAWACALLQETHTQPWGNLQEAVQESMELAEAVDLHQLPGLQPLWTKRDLNIQGDANHFVNSLWNLSQTRALHYRFAEMTTPIQHCHG